MKRFSRLLVPGSFDGLTKGHLHLFETACTLADSVTILVLDSDLKSSHYLFGKSWRVQMCRQAFDLLLRQKKCSVSSIQFDSYDGILADAVNVYGADGILRGIRDESDRAEDEAQMRLHELIAPGISEKVHYVEAAPGLQHVSSSIVKSFVQHGVDVSNMVPVFVKQLLEEQICGQYRIAITGSMGSGKTHVAKALVEYLESTRKASCLRICVDEILRDLYTEPTAGGYVLRDKLAELLGSDVLIDGGCGVDRELMKQKLFSPDCSDATRQEIHQVTLPYVEREIREQLSAHKGVVLFEWAKLAENQLGAWANNNVIFVESPDRDELLKKRDLSPETVAGIDAAQWSSEEKFEALRAQAHADDSGRILQYVNRLEDKDRFIPALADSVIEMFPGLSAVRYGDIS